MKRPNVRGAARARGRGQSAQTESVATVRIDSIAAGGDGVGRIEGLACFVPRTAPGDLAQVAYVPHAHYARGRLLQLLESSADRVDASCPHYTADRCGGCQLQHLSTEAQRDVRRRIVRDALQRVGHRTVALPDLVSGESWGYRERLTLALRARGASWIGGLHAFDDASRVFPLETCLIAHPRLVECWTTLRRHLRSLPTPRADSPLRLSVRLQGAEGDQVAVVVQGGAQWPEAEAWASQVRAAVPMVAAVWWERDGGSGFLLSGPPERDVLAFAQVNPVVADALRAWVRDEIARFAPESVIDGYSGRGDLAESLARSGVAVVAIEADGVATAQAARRLAPFPSSRVVTARVEEAIDAVLPADVVVLNPPRRGIDVRVAATLNTAHGVRAIVYVSCDPATLARDVSRLRHWRIDALRCFDMFPQTAHVETVCVLTPETP